MSERGSGRYLTCAVRRARFNWGPYQTYMPAQCLRTADARFTSPREVAVAVASHRTRDTAPDSP